MKARRCHRIKNGPSREGLLERYLTARERVVENGYGPEIDWQHQAKLSSVQEPDFLREAAWVILSSGMRESVVRGVFGTMSTAFLEWQSGAAIAARRAACIRNAAHWFDHRPKLRAIADIAGYVGYYGFEYVRSLIRNRGPAFLSTLPFIGPVTSFHLAKNLGLDVVKPDRHMLRLARAACFDSPHDLCTALSQMTGDRLGVVDLVLWRYATLDRGYELAFSNLTDAEDQSFKTSVAA